MSGTSIDELEALGEPALRVRAADGAEATVLMYGAHVISWKPPGAREQLYLSPRAVAGAGRAVRGGIPVIFPQFDRRGPEPQLPRHGFARTRRFQRASATDGVQVSLVLRDDEETRAFWPQEFALRFDLALWGPTLDIALVCHNTGSARWSFTAALHTYLAVSELGQVRIRGLDGVPYWDNVAAREGRESEFERGVDGEIDRLYRDVDVVTFSEGTRRVGVTSDGLSDAVLWNPGPEKCALLSDMPPDGWRSMLCLEAARIFQPPQLEPGARWRGRQRLTLQEV